VDEPELFVPPQVVGGVFANYVDVFDDVEYVTLDFALLDPRNSRVGIVVARISVPTSCILMLKTRMEHLQ
jgi:hypothetical protein